MTNEIKEEASLPVQARIDIRTLANLVEYWKMNGEQIRSMSQLLSWSVELLQHLLSTNNMLLSVIDSVSDANRYLIESGLYQPGSRKRGHAKLFQSMSFESLRNKGIDPSTHVKPQYNTMHKKRSDKYPGLSDPGFSEPVVVDTSSSEQFDDMWERAQERIKEEEVKEKAEKVPDTSEIVPQIMSAGLNQELYNKLMAEPVMESKIVKKSDAPRVKTEEENEREALELEKGDRLYEEKLKNM